MMLSVVIPTYNRGPQITLTLDSLRQQEAAPAFEVIVVDNHSSDGTGSVIRAYAAQSGGLVQYLFEPVPGSSAARNAGAAAARGEVIAFLDDDVIATPRWLRALSDAFAEHRDAWCVGGKVVLQLPGSLPPWFDDGPGPMTTYLSLQNMGEGTFPLPDRQELISANLAVRRDAFSRLGGFDVTLGRFGRQLLGGEDGEFCRRITRAGGTLYYCGAAAVIHLVPPTRLTKAFFRERAYWEGRYEGLLRVRRGVPLTATEIINAGWTIVKDLGKSLAYRAAGNPVRAVECDLAARKRLGVVHEWWRGRRDPRRPERPHPSSA